MRRIQIYMDEAMDGTLEREAFRRHTSKAALIRAAVAKEYEPLPPIEDDPITKLIGSIKGGEPTDDIDEVIYGG
jgi:hypothetical protein